jgi:YesN/AraC family two-component response regulator
MTSVKSVDLTPIFTPVDGEDAIKMYEADRDKIDIIILDVIMPKKNGKEVYNHIRKIDPEAKAIFISGYTEDILTSKGIYEEGLEFIAKPVNIIELMKKLRAMLDKHKGTSSL